MMQLMPKRMVAATLATQRKEEIDRGVKLAEKVDAVRDTLAQEEKRLSEFRALSIAQVQVEIDSKLREKNAVEREILVRREELKKLREPLDAEWATVQGIQETVKWQKQELYEKQSALDYGLRLNIQRERMNNDETTRINTLKAATEHDLAMAKEARDDAVRDLMNARSQASKIVADAKEREEAVEIREESVEIKDEWIKQQEKKLAKRDKDQNDREKLINDKYKTLLRTQARL